MAINSINFDAPDVQHLLAQHINEAHQDDCSNALDISALRIASVSMFEMRDAANNLMGFAALKALSDTEGEIKSVRTHPDHLRQGVSRQLMDYIETLARQRGYAKLLLETHPTEQYAPARALYERRGYTYRGTFGDYGCSTKSVFMELIL